MVLRCGRLRQASLPPNALSPYLDVYARSLDYVTAGRRG
jgi:hypothetical protein